MILYSPMHFISNINRFIITAFIIFNSFSAYSANTGHDEYSERNEADSFIARMPEKLQERQTEAIRKAMSGNNDMLLNVRNARNTAAKLPNGVYRTDISKSLTLLEASATTTTQHHCLYISMVAAGL